MIQTTFSDCHNVKCLGRVAQRLRGGIRLQAVLRLLSRQSILVGLYKMGSELDCKMGQSLLLTLLQRCGRDRSDGKTAAH
jgi:hypothetical protein